MEQRHERGISVFETAGGYAPTMGIVGTVMGLVHVLGNMSTPDALAPAIAVAFIATLYGIGTANLLWLPIAAKLKVRNSEETLYRSLAVEGLLAIQEKENPNFIEKNSFSFRVLRSSNNFQTKRKRSLKGRRFLSEVGRMSVWDNAGQGKKVADRAWSAGC